MDVPPESLDRREFQGYVERHEDDRFAHAASREETRLEFMTLALSNRTRIEGLELWQARIVGAVSMLTFLVLGGVVAAVIELLRK
jgi:hypothetical protein